MPWLYFLNLPLKMMCDIMSSTCYNTHTHLFVYIFTYANPNLNRYSFYKTLNVFLKCDINNVLKEGTRLLFLCTNVGTGFIIYIMIAAWL